MDKKSWMRKSKCFTIFAITAGCLLASSAHAVLVAEIHSCGPSATGGSFYGPNEAASRLLLDEYTPVPVSLYIDQLAYAYPDYSKGGQKIKRNIVTVPSGSLIGENIVVDQFDPAQAGGRVFSLFAAWDPTGLRAYNGTAADGSPGGSDGCRSAFLNL